MVPRDKDHATSAVLHRPFIEAGGDDRIERLDDPGIWRQGRHDLCSRLRRGTPRPLRSRRLEFGLVPVSPAFGPNRTNSYDP